MGTNMFALVSSPARVSLTSSDPRPTSLPSSSIKAEPDQWEWAGAVKIAPSKRYSHAPANSRRATTLTVWCLANSGQLNTRAVSPTPMSAEDPSSSGGTSSFSSGSTNPKPVTWS
jgi:hypothetical protein